MAARKNKDASPAETVVAFKGFDSNWQCRGLQYAVGATVEHSGPVKACSSGLHACEFPLDVLGYYAPIGDNGMPNRFALVEASGEIDRHNSDSKIAAARLSIKAEIKIPELVTYAVKWILDRCETGKSANEERSAVANTGDYSAASNTGDRSAASNTGDQSAASNTGYQSAASNTGNYSAASNTGDRSAASNTGYQSAASNTGNYSAASNTGDYSAASNTGDRSAASNTGDQSAASNTGDRSAASNTGDQSAASNTGNYSAASNTGDRSAASVEGKDSVAMASGYQGKAKACAGSAIVLCYRDDEGRLIHIRAGIAGQDGIKADTWYVLNEQGEFAEAAA